MPPPSERPLEGFDQVSRLYLGLARQATPSITQRIEEVNGQPALLVADGARLVTVIQFTVEEGRIAAIYSVVNPDKLQFIARQLENVGPVLKPAPGPT